MIHLLSTIRLYHKIALEIKFSNAFLVSFKKKETVMKLFHFITAPYYRIMIIVPRIIPPIKNIIKCFVCGFLSLKLMTNRSAVINIVIVYIL